MSDPKNKKLLSRRSFLRSTAAVAVTGVAGLAARNAAGSKLVWQIDPNLCVQCGKCATECVLTPSAVKCVHSYNMCGYCTLCFGYFMPDADVLGTAAENQTCPTGAIDRSFIEDPYYQYSIKEDLCIGCSKCVLGCNTFGNGSLHLQIRHDLCVNCNECRIARACPVDAFRRVPAQQAYMLKGETAVWDVKEGEDSEKE